MYLYCKYCERYYKKTGLLHCPYGQKNFHVLTPKIPRKRLIDAKISYPLPNSNPFLVFKSYLSSSYLFNGRQKNAYEDTVSRIDEGLKQIKEPGLKFTPLLDSKELTNELNLSPKTLFIKDETHNVTGSHKGRHAMGNLLFIETITQAQKNSAQKRDLAIYSCGNAALAASAVSKALGYKLYTFVPGEISEEINKRLIFYGAKVVKVPREGTGGDPCYLRFKEAVEKLSLLPCSCSGVDDWPNIEGGATLFYEMAYQLRKTGVVLDKIIVQVGGGALASAVIYSIEMLKKAGFLKNRPQVICVQTKGCYPLFRAYEKVKDLVNRYPDWDLKDVMKLVASRASEVMRPWDENIPESMAEGILDDVTYDWLAVIEGVLKTNGEVIAVDEELIIAAYKMTKKLGANVSATGTAGLAGLMALLKNGKIKKGEKIGLLFTGIGERAKIEVTKNMLTNNNNTLTLKASDPIEKILNHQ